MTKTSIFLYRPRVFGFLYLLMIPLYAAVYYFYPSILGPGRSYLECLYFSIVTITTLGYGDIAALGDIGKMITASEALLGVVVIGLFLNALANERIDLLRRQQAKWERNNYKNTQLSKLHGHYGLVRPVIERYRVSVIQLIQKAGPDPDEYSHTYDPNFEVRDMKDMYKPTRWSDEGALRPAIHGYFEAIDLIQKELSDLIKNVDLRYFPSIETHCLALAQIISIFDRSNEILSAIDSDAGDKKLADVVSDMLAKHEGDQFLDGENILNNYIALYNQIKLVMNSLQELEEKIDSVIASESSGDMLQDI